MVQREKVSLPAAETNIFDRIRTRSSQRRSSLQRKTLTSGKSSASPSPRTSSRNSTRSARKSNSALLSSKPSPAASSRRPMRKRMDTGSSTSTLFEEQDSDTETAPTSLSVGGDEENDADDEDYEAVRRANIQANLELMMSLGLYQTSKQIAPSTPKTKAASKLSSSSASHRAYKEKRVTRSSSRPLDEPVRRSTRMKRSLSDNADFASPRKSSRLYVDDFIVDSSSDEDEGDKRYIKKSTKRSSLNPTRRYTSDHLLQRQADRLGVRVHDPKTFGSIPGIPVGTLWEKRMDCSTDAVHAPTVAGISGNEADGCWSICLSGGYEDDIDLGYTFTYTGSGGRDLKGTKDNPKSLRTAPQSRDQTWEGKNQALRKSVETRKPVRVVRGYKGGNQFCPREGYVYCGLYRAKRAWREKGLAGFLVCKFEFERLPNQDLLPVFNHDEEEEQEEQEEAEVEHVAEKRKEQRASPAASASSRASSSSSSRYPVMKSPTFNREEYIVISDSEDEDVETASQASQQEVLLQLVLDSPPPREKGENDTAQVRKSVRTRSKAQR